MNVQIIDIIVGAILAYGLVHGYYKGIVQQLGSLGGLIVAILFANLFTPIFENLLNKFDFASPGITHKLAYLTSFLVLLFGCNFLPASSKEHYTVASRVVRPHYRKHFLLLQISACSKRPTQSVYDTGRRRKRCRTSYSAGSKTLPNCTESSTFCYRLVQRKSRNSRHKYLSAGNKQRRTSGVFTVNEGFTA